MEKIDVIMAYDWEELITGIIEGIKNFVDKLNKYFPKSKYNFEDPGKYAF